MQFCVIFPSSYCILNNSTHIPKGFQQNNDEEFEPHCEWHLDPTAYIVCLAHSQHGGSSIAMIDKAWVGASAFH